MPLMQVYSVCRATRSSSRSPLLFLLYHLVATTLTHTKHTKRNPSTTWMLLPGLSDFVVCFAVFADLCRLLACVVCYGCKLRMEVAHPPSESRFRCHGTGHIASSTKAATTGAKLLKEGLEKSDKKKEVSQEREDMEQPLHHAASSPAMPVCRRIVERACALFAKRRAFVVRREASSRRSGVRV